jgi:Rhodanese-related sulfurtransferase
MRHNMPSGGHIPGARQLVWQDLFLDPRVGTLKPRAELASEFARRAAPGDTVVAYCYVGYRASMSYLIARYLGYTAKLYDGSYQDWAARSLPLTRGKVP